jgi:hemin uptake protein HemP
MTTIPNPPRAKGDTASPAAEFAPPQPASATAGPQAVVLDSVDLLQGRTEILIRHGDETYRLRQTRNGKLILQK